MEAIKADFVSLMAYKEQTLLTSIRNLRDANQGVFMAIIRVILAVGIMAVIVATYIGRL